MFGRLGILIASLEFEKEQHGSAAKQTLRDKQMRSEQEQGNLEDKTQGVFARDTLIKEFIPVIHRFASKLKRNTPPSITMDELVSAGMYGLADAIGKYDDERSDKFKQYAEARIRGAMMDEIRSLAPLSRDQYEKSEKIKSCIKDLKQNLGREPEEEEIAENIGVELSKYQQMLGQFQRITVLSPQLIDKAMTRSYGYPERRKFDPQDDFFFLELREELANAIKELTSREQIVLAMYYKDEILLKDIGVHLGITESRVSQILTQAILRLRSKMEDL
jgi:RNA polymerase sigma factor for flagellar operon FliA